MVVGNDLVFPVTFNEAAVRVRSVHIILHILGINHLSAGLGPCRPGHPSIGGEELAHQIRGLSFRWFHINTQIFKP